MRGLPSSSTAATAARLFHPRFNEKIIDHFENPRNVGSFDKNDSSAGTGFAISPTGCRLKLQIKVAGFNGIIIGVRYKGFGCPVAISLSSVASKILNLDEALLSTDLEIIKYFQVPPIKYQRACRLLMQSWILNPRSN